MIGSLLDCKLEKKPFFIMLPHFKDMQHYGSANMLSKLTLFALAAQSFHIGGGRGVANPNVFRAEGG